MLGVMLGPIRMVLVNGPMVMHILTTQPMTMTPVAYLLDLVDVIQWIILAQEERM